MPSSPLPQQPFFALPGQRVGLARERFFAEGHRPTGLVGEPVIQSWTRCLGARRSPRETLAFDPVTRSRLHAALARNRGLLSAASAELQHLEAALGGTACRVLLTDANGVLVHATAAGVTAADPVLRRVSRLGVNLAEGVLGTNAPAVVVKTGAAVTVLGAEHYFDCMHELRCAAAPIHDARGRLAGVLDLSIEARPFGFDAAALVGMYATAIENRLLQAGAGEHLVLQFQLSAGLLGSPWQALVGVDGRGGVAWLNGAAQQLLGLAGAGSAGSAGTAGAGAGAGADARGGADAAGPVELLFGSTLAQLVARSASGQPAPLRLPNGLTVWLRASLHAADGQRHAVALRPAHGMPAATAEAATAAAAPAQAAAPAAAAPCPAPATSGPTPAAAGATLDQHTREVIERTLAAHDGNISRSARALHVSRGLLYRRLREWAQAAGA